MSSKQLQKQMAALRMQAAQDKEENDEEEEEEEEEDGEDGNFSGTTPSIRRRIFALEALQEATDAVTAEYKKERVLLEAKYALLKKPMFEKRAQIIAGTIPVEAIPKESEEGAEGEAATGAAAEEEEEESEDVGIPNFWLQAMVQSNDCNEFITEEDVPALKHLKDITVDYNDSYTSFTLTFHFSENEFFTNTTLTKSYTVSPDLIDDQAPELDETVGSEILWKAGKDLTKTTITKKQKAKSGKNKGQTRTITQHVDKRSFFRFFNEPTEEDDEEDEDEDEDKQRVQLSIGEDYDIAHTIRTAIIPEAVRWFTGEACDDDDDGMFELDGEEEDGASTLS